MYLPRGTIQTSKNEYWYFIKKNKEIVNFTLENMNKETGKATLQYDHTDVRYGKNQLHAIIKRNYRDKSLPWWKEYKEAITLILYIFVFTISIVFILNKIGDIADKLTGAIDIMKQAVQLACSNPNSGVISP